MAITEDVLKILQQGLALPVEKRIYANGFTFSISPADCTLVLLYNSQPIATINLSYSVAKSLGNSVNILMKSFEKDSKISINTVEEIERNVIESRTAPADEPSSG